MLNHVNAALLEPIASHTLAAHCCVGPLSADNKLGGLLSLRFFPDDWHTHGTLNRDEQAAPLEH